MYATRALLDLILMVTACGIGLPTASAAPLVNILLNDYGYLYDVMQSTPQDNGQCGLGFGIDFPYFGHTYDSLLLNGGTRPYVDVNIPSITFGNGLQYSDFTFRINLIPISDPPNGTVFNYRSNTCSTDAINELKLWFVSGDLYASKSVGGNEPEVTVFTKSFNNIIANNWQFLGVGVDAFTGYITIMVDSFTFYSGTSSTPQKALNTPGVIRLGGGFENSMGLFSGGMTCFGMYEELLDANNKHSYTLSNCMMTTGWNSWPNGLPAGPDPTGCTSSTGNTPTATDRTKGKFLLTGNDMAPSCHVISTNSGVVRVTVECAMMCLQDNTCLSFTVATSLSVMTCSLFSSIHTDTVATPNTIYYVADI
ncbi:uncharacterized protein LOC117338605 [Pecten maximus]|uniref:uncharacterized protein LOC117338605 n=1 Tax=Pecten maximus TaxID=6579 RepID=UPI001458B5B7|nr:uncharacterized protein LOC117338605 [Pecten maximus]